MLKFKTRTVKIGKNEPRLVADFGSGKYDILSSLFTMDYPKAKDDIISCLETALAGTPSDFKGDSTSITATAETAHVEGILVGVNTKDWCDVGTQDLLDALKHWQKLRNNLA